MCSEVTLNKVRLALTSQLLPTDRLRAIVDSQTLSVRFDELSEVEGDAEFIIVAYERLLGRPPGEHCLANWLGRLSSRTLSRAEIVDRLRLSDEGRARQVTVPGLDYALAVSSKRFFKRWAGWWAWKKRVFKEVLHSQLHHPLATATLADKVVTLEQQFAEAVAGSLHVFEHIEHRLGRSFAASTSQPAAIPQHEPTHDRVYGKQTQLYQRITELAADAGSPVGHAIAKVLDLLNNDLRSLPWLFAGVEAHEVMQTCKQQRIEIGAMATPTACLGYAQQQGIEAVDVPLGQFLHTADRASAAVVWLRSQFSDCSDNYLVDCLRDIQLILVPDGYLVFEENDEHSFRSLRIKAAIDVCGFKPLPAASSASWKGSSQRSYFVAQKTPRTEVVDYA